MKMQMPKVTVIVPVYNTEKYLPRCVESLMAQTLKELEIIFVDDGSTDSSGRLCDEYASKDNRIHVIHKPNGGVAAARQTGLEAAAGKYVIWADSDDWVEVDMYEKLYQKAQSAQADLTVCGFIYEYKDGIREFVTERVLSTKKECIINFLGSAISNSLWNKLFVRDLILKHNISLVAGLNMGEDRLFLFKYLYYAVNIVAEEPGFFYHYNKQNEISLTHQRTKESIEEDKKTIEILQSILQGSEYMEYLLPYVARHNVSIIAGLIEKNEIVMAKCIVESTPFSTVFPYLSRLDHRISCLFIYARIYRILHFILKFRRYLLLKIL